MIIAVLGIGAFSFNGVLSEKAKADEFADGVETKVVTERRDDMAVATFGGGCFWCTEAVFQELNGVEKVTSGYMGGHMKNPTYKAVCTGTTGHAEVVQITYDPSKVSFEKLLEVFFATHDPTTLNRQGNDVGTQYRSAIFYHSDEQKEIASKIKDKLNESKAYRDPIVTEIVEAREYYIAEDYHQDYFAQNGRQPYCRAVIKPKMNKFRRVFKEDLKKEK